MTVALDVFIKMNTSSVRLTPFDIVVAQVEESAGRSLHDLLTDIHARVPRITAYTDDLGTLLLDVSCLLSGRAATRANYQRLDFRVLPEEWASLVPALQELVRLLEEDRVFDSQRLPTSALLPVIAALAHQLPTGLDDLGNARALLRYYFWRASLTRRYESSTGSRTFQDYQHLQRAIATRAPLAEVSAPVFDEAQFPLPTQEQLIVARWPKSRDSLARAVLALSLREGAFDLADDAPIGPHNVATREYHHLFPDSILQGTGHLEESESFRALNCALISMPTNRHVSNASPLEYLRRREDNALLGVDDVRRRLASHLVPFGELHDAGPYGDDDSALVIADYERFLLARAQLVGSAALRQAGAGLIGTTQSQGTD